MLSHKKLRKLYLIEAVFLACILWGHAKKKILFETKLTHYTTFLSNLFVSHILLLFNIFKHNYGIFKTLARLLLLCALHRFVSKLKELSCKRSSNYTFAWHFQWLHTIYSSACTIHAKLILKNNKINLRELLTVVWGLFVVLCSFNAIVFFK